MTVQTNGGQLNTRDAVVDVTPGTDRQTVFNFVRDQFKKDFGPVVVLFYDLQLATL